MLSSLALLVIEIGIDPEIREFGGLLLTWHGVFTAIGIAAGVTVAVILGRRLGFLEDDIYTAALIAIPFGIVGARALYVIENWGEPNIDEIIDIFQVNEGGISIWGAVIGGFVGGLIYGYFRKLPIRRALDIAAIALILGMGIGRVGDVINGEHFAETSDLPWAVRYTNLNSPSVTDHPLPECRITDIGQIENPSELCAQHPAVGYEMVGDFLIFGLLLFMLLSLRRDGVVFFSFFLLYSLMRFGVSELRLDSEEVFAGLTVPQVTSLIIIPFALVGLIWAWRKGSAELEEGRAPPSPARAGAPVTES